MPPIRTRLKSSAQNTFTSSASASRTRRPNGKLLRQETTVYSVVPTSSGIEEQTKSLDGRYWRKGEYIDYHSEPRPNSDSIDGDLVKEMRDDFANERIQDGLDEISSHSQAIRERLLVQTAR